MIRSAILLSALFIGHPVFSQNQPGFNLQARNSKIDSLKKIDFIHYDYKYLDSDFKIVMDESLFKETLSAFEFYEDRISGYEDSISVVLMHQFKDWDAARIAKIHILYSWERLGHYLHYSATEAKKVGEELGFEHPYLARAYMGDGGDRRSIEKEKIRKRELDRLIGILSVELLKQEAELKSLTGDDLLKLAFHNNPVIMEKRRQFEMEQNERHKHKRNSDQ